MKQMTTDNLGAAFAGESQAHMKYMAFADKADAEGKTEVARLFRAISFAEKIHATNHFKTLGNVGSTAENLEGALGGETYEIDEMYPSFVAVAENQNEKSALQSLNAAFEAEKVHQKMYRTAVDAVAAGNDASTDKIAVCEVCGWTVQGEAPDTCPVCKAKKDKFKIF